MTTSEDASAARWRAADELARGNADGGLSRRRRGLLVWLLGLFVACVLLGSVLALVLPRPAPHVAGGGSGVREITGLVFVVLGLGIEVGGLIWGVRTRHYVTRWSAVTSPLSRSERKSVLKQIRGKLPLDREHEETIIAAARQLRRGTLGIAPIYAGAVLIILGVMFTSTLTVTLILDVIALACFVFAGIQILIYYRQMGAFLEAHSGGS